MQEMTYTEREKIKRLDFEGEQKHLITLIAHWHRQRKQVSFSVYASNWAEARLIESVEKIKKAFPHCGKRYIKDGCSDFDFEI